MLTRAFKHIVSEYPFVLVLLVLMMFAVSALESFSVASLIPMIESSQELNKETDNKIYLFFKTIFDAIGVEVTLPALLLFITAITAIKSLLNIVKSVFMKSIQADYDIKSKSRVMKSIFQTNITYLQSLKTSEIVSVANQETRLMSSLVFYFSNFFHGIIGVIIYLVLIFFVSWQLTIFTLVVGGATYALLFGFYEKGRRAGSALANLRSKVQTNFQNSLSGIKTVKSYNLEPQIKRNLEEDLAQLKKEEVNIAWYESVQRSFFEPLTFFIGFIAVLTWEMQFSSFLVFLVAIGRMYIAIRQIQNTHYKIAVFVASLDEFDKVMADFEKHREVEHEGGQLLKSSPQKIEFTNTLFSYVSSKNGFQLGPLNLTIKSGQTVGIVGSSGSGKSTMSDLLLGIIKPTKGAITIDGMNSSAVDAASWRSKISYVEQSPFVFNDTVKNNITLWDEGFSLEEVEEACRLVQIDEYVQKLPKKYDTLMGECGTSFSGGQKQRIALARAVIRKNSILVLDEVTSALDTQLEHSVQEMLTSLHGNMTTIIISHRLNFTKNLNQIYVVDHGKIVEEGSFTQLMERGGHFKKMYQVGT